MKYLKEYKEEDLYKSKNIKKDTITPVSKKDALSALSILYAIFKQNDFNHTELITILELVKNNIVHYYQTSTGQYYRHINYLIRNDLIYSYPKTGKFKKFKITNKGKKECVLKFTKVNVTIIDDIIEKFFNIDEKQRQHLIVTDRTFNKLEFRTIIKFLNNVVVTTYLNASVEIRWKFLIDSFKFLIDNKIYARKDTNSSMYILNDSHSFFKKMILKNPSYITWIGTIYDKELLKKDFPHLLAADEFGFLDLNK